MKADRFNAAAMRADTMFGGLGIFLDDSSLLCFASDPAKTWRGWLYRQLGCPSRQLGRPFWRLTHHGGLRMSDFTYNFPNQVSLDK